MEVCEYHLKFPALILSGIVLIPQVSILRGGEAPRPDILGNAPAKPWKAVEFDGDGHNSARDGNRSEQLALPVHRFSASQLEADDFVERLISVWG